MNNVLQWKIAAKQADYNALVAKDSDTLYFVQDTGEIYKGEQTFTQAVVLYGADQTVKSRPAAGALGKLYVDAATLAGSVWTGSAWKEVVKPLATDVENGTGLVTAEQVKSYVEGKVGTGTSKLVKTVAWDEEAVGIKVTLADDSESTVPLTKLATQLVYDGGTGKLSLQDKAGTELNSVNIPLDNFVKSGEYDEDSKTIVLTMQNGGEVRIPATDLVDIYTGTTSDNATVTVTGTEIAVTVKVDPVGGNLLTSSATGLKVMADTTKMNLVADATDHVDELLKVDADGQAQLTGYKIGGATVADSGNETLLATEAAVKAIVATFQHDQYVQKSSIVAETVNVEAPDATKVVSEKALVAALTWGTVPPAEEPEEPEPTVRNITVTQTENGTITVNDGQTDHTDSFTAADGTNLTITAEASEGFEVTELKFGEESISSGDSRAVSGDVVITGTFTATVGA